MQTLFPAHVRQNYLFLFLVFFAINAHAQEVFAPRELKAIPVRQTQKHPAFRTLWKTFDGPQASNYPTQIQPKIESGFDVPVLIGSFPNRQYTVLGHIYILYPVQPFKNQRTEAIRAAALNARIHGADAFLLRPALRLASDYYAAGTAIKWR